MMTALARAALFFALTTTISCRDATMPEWEVRGAEAQWARRGAPSYRITVSRDCFCTTEMMGPVIVDVVNGAVVSRHYEVSGAPVPDRYAELFPSIEGLFAIIDAARRDRRQLDVAFHPTYGYPTRIDIDRDHRPWDGGQLIAARDLVLR